MPVHTYPKVCWALLFTCALFFGRRTSSFNQVQPSDGLGTHRRGWGSAMWGQGEHTNAERGAVFPPTANYISQNSHVSVLHMRRDRLGAREAPSLNVFHLITALRSPPQFPVLSAKKTQREAQVALSNKPTPLATRPTPFQEFYWVGSHFTKSLGSSLWNLTLSWRPFVLLAVRLSTSLRGPVSIKYEKRGNATQRFI